MKFTQLTDMCASEMGLYKPAYCNALRMCWNEVTGVMAAVCGIRYTHHTAETSQWLAYWAC
jgi:hypothetical protein